jgi:hypothetical protein
MCLAIGLVDYEYKGSVFVVGVGLSVHLMEMLDVF